MRAESLEAESSSMCVYPENRAGAMAASECGSHSRLGHTQNNVAEVYLSQKPCLEVYDAHPETSTMFYTQQDAN